MINIYESYQEALHAIQELEAAKIPSNDISLIALNGKDRSSAIDEFLRSQGQKDKKTAIAEPLPILNLAPHVRGKFFSGLDLCTLKGLGDVIAAGWLLDHQLSNAAAEREMKDEEDVLRLVDCMVVCGLSEDDARTYLEGIRRGATLLGVRASDRLAEAAERIMRQEHKPLDPHMRGQHYWTGAARQWDKESSSTNRLLAVLISAAR